MITSTVHADEGARNVKCTNTLSKLMQQIKSKVFINDHSLRMYVCIYTHT